MADKRASDLLVSEEKRLEIMNMVKEGKISPQKAMDKVLALDKKMAKEVKREEEEKERQLARMTPKARQMEVRLREQHAAKAGEERAAMVISPTAYITSPVVVQDLMATEMTMTDADRMDIMSLVKSGTMSVDQAMTRVRMKEQRASELRLQLQSPPPSAVAAGASAGAGMPSDPPRSPPLLKPRSMKKARLSEDEPVVLETWAPEEYDRTHPEDYDPDVARSCWDMEKEEEQERQLLDRWALLELDGAECTERIEYYKTKVLRAEMEAAAEKAAAARRKAAKAKLAQFQTKTDWGNKFAPKADGGASSSAARAPPSFHAAEEDAPPAFSDDDAPPAFSDDDDDNQLPDAAAAPDPSGALGKPAADPGAGAETPSAAGETAATCAPVSPVGGVVMTTGAIASSAAAPTAAMEQLQLNVSVAEANVAAEREKRALAESAAINALTFGSGPDDSEEDGDGSGKSPTEEVSIEAEMARIRQQAKNAAMLRLHTASSSDDTGNTTMELTLDDEATNDDEV